MLEPATASMEPDAPLLPTTRDGRRLLIAVLLVALALRLFVVLETKPDYVPQTDALHFDLIATSLANGDGYGDAVVPPQAEGPGALRAPLYPFTLAAVYTVFGDHSWTWGRVANAMLGTALVAMLGLVAASLWSRRVALVAMVIAAVHPTLMVVGSSLNLEALLVTLSLASLAAALQQRRRPKGAMWPVLAGLLLGLTILTRELGFVLVPSIAWLVWTTRPRWSRRALVAPLLVLCTAFIVVIPWTITNAVRLDAFIPVTTSSGYGLAGTYNETARNDRAEWIAPDLDPEARAVIDGLSNPTEVEIDRALRDHSLDFVRDHPTYPVEVAFWNTVRLFDLDLGDYNRSIAPFVPYPGWLVKVSIVASFAVLAVAIIGAFTRAARRVPLAVWAIPVLTYLFMVVTLPASVRYRASMEPYFVMLAALPLTALLERFLAARAAAIEALSSPAGAS